MNSIVRAIRRFIPCALCADDFFYVVLGRDTECSAVIDVWPASEIADHDFRIRLTVNDTTALIRALTGSGANRATLEFQAPQKHVLGFAQFLLRRLREAPQPEAASSFRYYPNKGTPHGNETSRN
jgi:hypothetical protein